MEIQKQPAAPTQVKFTPEEIGELTTIRESYDQITVSLGQLEMQKRAIKNNEAKLQERLTSVEANEKIFLDKIVAKYGEGSFDIATGVFTPKKG